MNLPRSPFGTVCHLVNGKAFKPADWSGAGVPIIRIQNLNEPDKPFNYWAGALEKQVLVKTGDLLLAWSGTPGTSFGAHIWSGSDGILNQHIFRCDLDRKAITKEWAKIAVNHRLHRLIEQAHGGVGLQHVTRGMVEELEIPLPPLAEQRRIAAVLDKAEALRARRRAALAELDDFNQSLFLDLFGDPVINPKKWPRKLFSEIGTLDRGVSKHRPRNAPELLGGPYPLVQTGEVANCAGYIREYHSTYSEVGLRQSKMWPSGTLCITIAANIAKTGILTFDACFPDSIVGFRADDAATVEFVRSWLSFLQKSLEDAAPESAQKNINLALLRNLSVPLPPLSLQREFARRVGAVERLQAAQRSALAELDALFAALQHRAFRGEL